jgi:ubiquinone/menaquinone biosynthesis C-methylase UbiE
MEKQPGEKHPYLICPVSKGDLFIFPETGDLFCPKSGITYPIYKGIPAMMDKSEFLNPSQQFYEDVKKTVNQRNFINYFDRRWSKMLQYTNIDQLGPGSRILENGAGQGEATQLLSERTGADVFAVDYSMTACLSSHRSLGENSRVIQTDTCALPFADDYFDFVLGNAILHHIEDQKKAVEESVRVCKSGGYVVYIEPNRFHPIQMFIAMLHPMVEKGTLLMNPKKIRRYFLETGIVQDVKLVPIFTILFAYQKFPPDALFPFFRDLEPLFDKPLLCTSYFIIARLS